MRALAATAFSNYCIIIAACCRVRYIAFQPEDGENVHPRRNVDPRVVPLPRQRAVVDSLTPSDKPYSVDV